MLLFLDDDVVAVVGIIIILLVDITIVLVVVKVFFPLNSKLCVCLCRVNGSRLVRKVSVIFPYFISLVQGFDRLLFRVSVKI